VFFYANSNTGQYWHTILIFLLLRNVSFAICRLGALHRKTAEKTDISGTIYITRMYSTFQCNQEEDDSVLFGDLING
jgi:hypothetical protein